MSKRKYAPQELHELLLPMRAWWYDRAVKRGWQKSWVVWTHGHEGDTTRWLYYYLCRDCDLLEVADERGTVIWQRRLLIQSSGYPASDTKIEELMMSFLKKRIVAEQTVSKANLQQSKLASLVPAIVEMLVADKWPEDGSPRKPSTLTVSIVDGAWKLALNDRDAEASTFVTAATFEDALKALETRIQADECDWRAWQSAYKNKGKKR